MNNAHKQLVIRKREDWVITSSGNILRDEDSITLENGASNGFFSLRAIDSREKGFEWGRVSLECHLPEDSLIRTFAYASDTDRFGGTAVDSYVPTANEYVPSGSSEDFYLNVTGRYLWLRFEFLASGEAPKLKALRLYLTGDHMIDYLPEIYRKDGDFAKRFLSVFDSLFMDMERAIYDLPARFDFEKANGEMLRYLAQWVCVDADGLDDEMIVERIRTAFGDYGDMYTVDGIARSARRLCGMEPLIIESADVDPNNPDCANSSLYRRLYGENPYKFFILLEETCFPNRDRMENFILEMKRLIPANTEFELVLLKNCVQLDWHTYLEVNSVVGDYSAIVIDENSAIHYDTTIGGNNVEGY